MDRLANLSLKLRFPKLLKSDFEHKDKDIYILPSDKPTESEIEDVFERSKSISDTMSDAILSSDGQMNFLISGEWGMGKTSIVNALREKLERNKIKTITFSPWKYASNNEASSNISRSFLVKLAEKLHRQHEVKNLYLNRKIETQRGLISQILIWGSYIFSLVIYSTIGIGIYNLASRFLTINDIFNKLDNSEKITLALTVAGILFIPKIGDLFSNKIRQSSDMQTETSPEQLETTYKNILDKSLKFKTLQYLLSKWESMVEDTPLFFLGTPLTTRLLYNLLLDKFRIKKLVVFVDDLDRCGDSEIKEFLSGLKTFLDDRRVYFVISADMRSIEKSLENKTEYLRKIIQISWSVPYLDRKQISKFIDGLIKDSKSEVKIINCDYLANLSIGVGNPRKIKYYIRRLLFILNYNKNLSSSPENQLTPGDVALLFKLIMIADIDNNLFIMMAKNNQIYLDIENNKNEVSTLLAEHTNAEFIQTIVRQYPKFSSSTNSLLLSQTFALVESVEGKTIDATRFFEISADKPSKANDFIYNEAPFSFNDLVNQLFEYTKSDIEVISKFQPQTQDGTSSSTTEELEVTIEPPKEFILGVNRVYTLILIIHTGLKDKRFEEKLIEISSQFFKLLDGISPNIYEKYFPANLFKLFSEMAENNVKPADSHLSNLVKNDYYSDEFENFSNLIATIPITNNYKFMFQKELLDALIMYNESQTDIVFKDLEKLIDSPYVQQKVLEDLSTYSPANKPEFWDKNIDLLLNSYQKLAHDIKKNLVDKIYDANDTVNTQRSIKLFPDIWVEKDLSSFISNSANTSFFKPEDLSNLIKFLWTPENINLFKLLNPNFFDSLFQLITKSDNAYRQVYLDELILLKSNTSDLKILNSIIELDSQKSYLMFIQKLKDQRDVLNLGLETRKKITRTITFLNSKGVKLDG